MPLHPKPRKRTNTMTTDHQKREASADMRTFARNVFDMYLALVQEGFTEGQAIEMTSTVVRSAMGLNGGAA